jgi:hypothetical protein
MESFRKKKDLINFLLVDDPQKLPKDQQDGKKNKQIIMYKINGMQAGEQMNLFYTRSIPYVYGNQSFDLWKIFYMFQNLHSFYAVPWIARNSTEIIKFKLHSGNFCSTTQSIRSSMC